MSGFGENPFQLNQGVDTYNPDVTATELRFVRLKNIQPKFGRWMTPDGLEVKEQLQSVSSFTLWFDVMTLNDGWIYTNWAIYGKVAASDTLVKIGDIPTSSPVGEIDFTTELVAAGGADAFEGFVVVFSYDDGGLVETWNSSTGSMYDHDDPGTIASASTSSTSLIGESGVIPDAPIQLKSDLTLPAGHGFGIQLTFPNPE